MTVEGTIVTADGNMVRRISRVRHNENGYFGVASLFGKKVKVHKAPRKRLWTIAN